MGWVQFMDMASGGGGKEKYSYIYIEASNEEEAAIIFYNRFGHSPHRVSCTCCGEDYSVSYSETLEEATAYNRGCGWDETEKKWAEGPGGSAWKEYVPLGEYLISLCNVKGGILVIPETEIKPEERKGELPVEGYVWH